jgi:hypothetical protein
MELQTVERKSSKVNKLVRQHFGPHEDLWKPKCCDMVFRLVHHGSTEPLAVCTLQLAPSNYWILGDLCVKEQRKGYGTQIVSLVMRVVNLPVWVDANETAAKIFEKDRRFRETTKGPWKPEGRAFIST